ncbi:hypothetical protein STEG23_005489 [Scotinomys teguina]
MMRENTECETSCLNLLCKQLSPFFQWQEKFKSKMMLNKKALCSPGKCRKRQQEMAWMVEVVDLYPSGYFPSLKNESVNLATVKVNVSIDGYRSSSFGKKSEFRSHDSKQMLFVGPSSCGIKANACSCYGFLFYMLCLSFLYQLVHFHQCSHYVKGIIKHPLLFYTH